MCLRLRIIRLHVVAGIIFSNSLVFASVKDKSRDFACKLGVKQDLARQGFYASEKIISLHTQVALAPLSQAFKQMEDTPMNLGVYAHKLGYRETVKLGIDKEIGIGGAIKINIISSSYNFPNERKFFPFVREVFRFIPAGKYAAELAFVSDIARAIAECEKFLETTDDCTVAECTASPLYWHHDKFPSISEAAKFDYLYFLVMTNSGISPHSLEIGRVAEVLLKPGAKDMASKTESNKDVELVRSLPGKAGAGYLVDQNHEIEGRVLVHRHDGYKGVIFNCPPDNEWLAKIGEIGISTEEKTYILDPQRNMLCKDYVQPKREKIIFRIKRLEDKQEVAVNLLTPATTASQTLQNAPAVETPPYSATTANFLGKLFGLFLAYWGVPTQHLK